MLFKTLTLLALSAVAAAQDFGVPTSWREFSNSRPLSQRISIAQTAINTMKSQLVTSTGQFNGISYWQSANVWSVLANQDYIAKTTVNKAATVNALNTVFGIYSNYDAYGYNDDALWWATAAYYAHRAYGDSDMLSHATTVWSHVNQYAITTQQALAGSVPYKDFSIKPSCDGATMAGGVFWRPTNDDQNINSITTGLFLSLSAYLAETTGNATYTSAGISAASWIKAHNINSGNIVLDTENAHDCTHSPSTELTSYNSGKYIEGLSVLASVTGNSQWTQLMENILASAVKSSVWEGSDGIITEGADTTADNDGVGFKAIFIRGLHEAFARSTNSNLRILVHSYIDVQYNAILELAASGTSYSANWHGPPQSFTSWGQLAAIDVLTAAIDINN